MSTQPRLARPFVVFGQAILPLAENLRSRLERPPLEAVRVHDMLGFISSKTRTLGVTVGDLSNEIKQGSDGMSDADVHRAVGRLEVHIESLLASYEEVERASPTAEDFKGWSLLRGLYRDVLLTIQSWLEDIVDISRDPVDGLRRRGYSTQGTVTIRLEFDAHGPKLEELCLWIEDQVDELEAAERSASRKAGGSLFWWVAAAFGVGWLIGGDDD